MTTIATSDTVAQAVLAIVTDLAQPLPPGQRYQRLVLVLRDLFGCEAVALLQLQGTILQPLAVTGLSEDALGRRFVIADQPRLSRILFSREPVRFDDDTLPDPYDGLVEGLGAHLPVHDCLGAALYVDEQTWGVLTLDALRPGHFADIDAQTLRLFFRLAEASVKAAQTLDTLREQIDREHQFNAALLAERSAHELIGKSPAMQTLRHNIETVAGSDLLVLILGETGVGKELVAQQLHRQSPRAQQTLVHVNCAALPETLAESELFGHRRGAFTGAVSDRAGKFELANGGTLLLDEIGELPLSIQAKLLRVLQSGEIQRVGSDRPLHVDVRVLAATNRDLKEEVAAGRFRADLYHRLSVFPVTVPPLRERGRDALTLAGYFLEANQQRLHVRNIRLNAAAKQALLDYDWPGNVRELEHVMSRAALLAAAAQRDQRWITIAPEHLGLRNAVVATSAERLTNDASRQSTQTLSQALSEFQKDWLQRCLQENNDNIAAAARSAGLDRSNFYRLLKKVGVR